MVLPLNYVASKDYKLHAQLPHWGPCWYLGNHRKPIMQQISLLCYWMSWRYVSIGLRSSTGRCDWPAIPSLVHTANISNKLMHLNEQGGREITWLVSFVTWSGMKHITSTEHRCEGKLTGSYRKKGHADLCALRSPLSLIESVEWST